jgi:hypothetical protein
LGHASTKGSRTPVLPRAPPAFSAVRSRARFGGAEHIWHSRRSGNAGEFAGSLSCACDLGNWTRAPDLHRVGKGCSLLTRLFILHAWVIWFPGRCCPGSASITMKDAAVTPRREIEKFERSRLSNGHRDGC